jgi:hypothetical protein
MDVSLRALTICQPHAFFIVAKPEELPQVDRLTPKRIENRPGPFGYRGPLLIHAGKSRKWLDNTGWDATFDASSLLTFGAFVGICELIDCLAVERCANGYRFHGEHEGCRDVGLRKKYPWLLTHYHTFGPHCLVLDKVRRFAKPIPWTGKQSLWKPFSGGRSLHNCEEGRLLRQAISTAEAIDWSPTAAA